MTRVSKFIAAALVLVSCAAFVSAQKRHPVRPKPKTNAGPTVTQIDIDGLKAILKPDGKPRLINFWATWCDPCREEFPDLVKLDAAYKGKIDFLTVSLDDVEDIRSVVPKFLLGMKSTMPAYLLHTTDESEAIAAISKDFHGSLPFTILLKPDGDMVYSREGKLHTDLVTAEIDKLLLPAK